MKKAKLTDPIIMAVGDTIDISFSNDYKALNEKLKELNVPYHIPPRTHKIFFNIIDDGHLQLRVVKPKDQMLHKIKEAKQ